MAKYCTCVSEETMTEKRMEKNEEVKEEEMMGGDDPLRKRLGRMTCLAKVSTMGKRFGTKNFLVPSMARSTAEAFNIVLCLDHTCKLDDAPQDDRQMLPQLYSVTIYSRMILLGLFPYVLPES